MNIYEKENFKHKFILKGLLPTGRNLFLPPLRRRLTPSSTMAPAKTGGDRHHSRKVWRAVVFRWRRRSESDNNWGFWAVVLLPQYANEIYAQANSFLDKCV